jgi:hypothetical protein
MGQVLTFDKLAEYNKDFNAILECQLDATTGAKDINECLAMQ